MIRNEDFRFYYEIPENALGQSPFALIYEGKKKKPNISKAIKVFQKNEVNQYLKDKLKRIPTEEELQKYFNAFRNEAINMEILQGKNRENRNAVILDECFETFETNECFETNNEFVIIMEKCDNDIFNHLSENGCFNAEEIYEILTQLNNSFKIMVENNIFHRAIKPQNILIKYLNEEKTKFLVKLKITDDSCSSNNSDKLLDSKIDRDYRIYAPEVLNENNYKFTEESDLWSLGVLIYLLYFNVFPFDGIKREEVLRNITEDTINKLEKVKDEDLNNLIIELLKIEPTKRITWDDYFSHSFFRKRMNFRDFYKCDLQFRGSCIDGKIYKGEDKRNGQEKAIKIMNKRLIKASLRRNPFDIITDENLRPRIERYFNEVNNMKILQGLNHENQNAVIFDEYFNTKDEFVIIMELCDGNLLDYFLRRNNKLKVEEIHDIISQLNNSFKEMVKNKILHRAIKPQNILIKYLNEEKTKFLVKLKLNDDSGSLDSSNELISPEQINRNLEIYAPEVLENRRFTEKSDLFSLGVLIYYLYFNKYPFEGKNREEILDSIKKGINGKLTNNPDFDDLLMKLLKGNEKERISWEDYFKHNFFRINKGYKEYYEVEEILGEIGYAKIYKAKDKATGEMKAIKIVKKDEIKNYWKKHTKEIKKPNDDDLNPYFNGYFNEVNHMKILQGINNLNQNTVIFNEYFNTKENFAIVMELCDGNLVDYIKDKDLKFEEIKKILIQLNNSFEIMYKNNIFHRAIKPENILYKKENSEILFKLKLTDISCLKSESSKIEMATIMLHKNLCISAPEVLKGEKFIEESDLWSLGILIYFLKFKDYPFKGIDKNAILKNIEEGLGNKLKGNSDLDDLIKNLLIVDSNKRMSWKKYFKHRFFNKK